MKLVEFMGVCGIRVFCWNGVLIYRGLILKVGFFVKGVYKRRGESIVFIV